MSLAAFVSMLACTIYVPLPPDAPPDAMPLQVFNIPLTAEDHATLSGTIPWSRARIVDEPENQREFILPFDVEGQPSQEILRLRSDGPSYSAFAPFKARIGAIEERDDGTLVFTERTQGACHLRPYTQAEDKDQ